MNHARELQKGFYFRNGSAIRQRCPLILDIKGAFGVNPTLCTYRVTRITNISHQMNSLERLNKTKAKSSLRTLQASHFFYLVIQPGCSHGEHTGQFPPIFWATKNFVAPRKISFKHIIKQKSCPWKMHFVSPNFKTWPQAYIQPTTNYHCVTTIGRRE